MLLDAFHYILQFQLELLGLDNKFFHLAFEQCGPIPGASRFDRNDHGPHSRLRRKEPFLDQHGNDLVGRIWIDAKLLTQYSDGGKTVARFKFTDDNRLLYRK